MDIAEFRSRHPVACRRYSAGDQGIRVSPVHTVRSDVNGTHPQRPSEAGVNCHEPGRKHAVQNPAGIVNNAVQQRKSAAPGACLPVAVKYQDQNKPLRRQDKLRSLVKP